MKPIKQRVLTLLNQYGQGPDKMLLLPMLDRRLVMVEREKEYIGGRLVMLIREMIDEGLVLQGQGLHIGLTAQGQQALANAV